MKRALLFSLFIFITSVAFGQTRVGAFKSKDNNKPEQFNGTLVIDKNYPVEEAIKDFFNNTCVQVSNIASIGTPEQIGFFWADQTSLGISAGIILTTGFASLAQGPNTNGSNGASAGGGSDPDLLNLIQGNPIYDAGGVQFDFVSSSPVLSFDYIFGSDEYPEYACVSFSDVFGFFITGPGFNGTENVAIIPGSNDIVKINNINNGTPGIYGNIVNCIPPMGTLAYSSYYVDNPIGSPEIEYDGYTIPISSKFTVIPGETYHAKLIVGDAADAIFDSGVLIGFSSLCGDSLFKPKQVNASVQKIGLNKFDFHGQAKYATSFHWDFGDNSVSSLQQPVHTYKENGEFKVKFIASNFCCSDTVTLLLNVVIGTIDVISQEIQPTCNKSCDGEISLEVIGGTPPFKYKWSNGETTNNISGLCTGNYTVTVTDSEGYQKITDFNIKEPDALELNIQQIPSGTNGLLTKLIVKGGTAPYSYLWSDGVKSSFRTDLKKGDGYAVKVTDKNGCTQELKQRGNLGEIVIFKAGFSTKISGRELTVNSFNLEKSKAEIRIFNTMGQSLYNSTIEDDKPLNINAGNWIGGIYFIQMINSEGVIQKALFIK